MTARDSRLGAAVGRLNIGDTMTDARKPALKALPGFQKVHPMVFSGIYPVDSADYEHLKSALAKLNLNDSAFQPARL